MFLKNDNIKNKGLFQMQEVKKEKEIMELLKENQWLPLRKTLG